MPPRAWKILSAVILLLTIGASPATAGKCDLFLPDMNDVRGCLEELKFEITILKMQLQTEQTMNVAARGNICLLATLVHTPQSDEIAEIACQEMKDRAEARKKAATKSKKPPAK